jgi:rSAM/selenodomain-associated transferase 2
MRRTNLNHNHGSDKGRISVIIPTINEIDNIEKALKSCRLGDTWEVIVADGGSSDGTVALAKSLGATVIESSPPKSRQMNQGAARATGDIFLFLHADTWLPGKFDEHILDCLRRSGVAAGAFKLHFESHTPALRVIENLANWRSCRLKTPYGDQAIFISAKLFHEIGGFPGIPIMEDFELVRQLRKMGGIVTLPVSVSTSARRWKKFGILKTTLINQMIIVAHFIGVSPDKIAKWYRRKKET